MKSEHIYSGRRGREAEIKHYAQSRARKYTHSRLPGERARTRQRRAKQLKRG